MKKLVTGQHPDRDKALELFGPGTQLLQMFLTILLAFQKETGIIIVDNGRYTLKEFFEKISVIPFSDIRQLKFKSDQDKDADTFTEWVLEQLYKIFNGRHGSSGPKLIFENFCEGILLPDDLIDELIAAKYDVEYWLRSLPKGIDMLQFFSVENATLHVVENAQAKLIEQYSTFADETQIAFFEDCNNALSILSRLEKKYQVPGLIQKAILHDGAEYKMSPEHLTNIR
jgi:hypothetical protein